MIKKNVIFPFISITTAFFIVVGGVVAQSKIPDAPEPETSGEAVGQQQNSDISNTGPDSQVFIPSEEISEDAPVAFPVDI